MSSWLGYQYIQVCLNSHGESSRRFTCTYLMVSCSIHTITTAYNLILSKYVMILYINNCNIVFVLDSQHKFYFVDIHTQSSKHRSSSLSVPLLRPSGSGSSLSPSTTPPSPHSPHQLNGSNGLSSSLTRRILRSRSTSLENGNELYRRVLKPLDQVCC